MTVFTQEALKEASELYAQHNLAAKNFLQAMNYQNGTPSDSSALFDSIIANATNAGMNVAAFVPQPLTDLMEIFKENKSSKKQLLDSVATGVEEYRSRHGVVPNANVVSAALLAAHTIYADLTFDKTGGIFDSSLAKSKQPETMSFYDSVNSGASTHIADVPALAMVTITMLIANASPITAYLPNPKGAATVPLIYVRHIAGRDYGSTLKGEFLDGIKAANQYFDAVHKFALTTADNITFTVTTKRQRNAANAPIGADRLPIVVGANRAYLNGILVGTDQYAIGKKNVASSKFEPLDGVSVTIAGVAYKLVSGTHDANTDKITLVFDKALPATAKVTVNTVADYERTDSSTGRTILIAPNTDVDLDYASISAYGVRAIYTATIDALSQIQNELGIDMRSAFVAIVIAKLMLEQNTRLLIELSERAEGLGAKRVVDMTRGSNMTAAFNKTSDIASEIFTAIEDAKRRIIEGTGHRPSGFDIYCTGAMGTMLQVTTDDTHYIPSALNFGMPNEIVRIGAKGADNYYYTAPESKILKEGEIDTAGVKAVYSELMVVGRNVEAAKSVCVGHIAVPVVTSDVRSEDFKQGVTYFSKMAAQVNDIPRYANQIMKIQAINMPKSLTTSAT